MARTFARPADRAALLTGTLRPIDTALDKQPAYQAYDAGAFVNLPFLRL